MGSGGSTTGRSIAAAGTWLVLAGGLGFLATTALPPDAPLPALACAIGFAALVLGVRHAGEMPARRARGDRIADAVDALSQRLVRIETRLSALDGAGSREQDALRDISGDMQSLGEVVRSLAEAMSVQDRELVGLRRAAERERALHSPTVAAPERREVVVPSFLPPHDPPRMPAVPAAELPRRADAADAGAILAAIANRQVDLHVQPIVSLPQRRARIYDLYPLLRLSGSRIVVPGHFMPILDQLGRTQDIDRLVVTEAIAVAEQIAASGRNLAVGCTLSSASLADEAVLEDIVTTMDRQPAAAARLILDVPQSCWAGRGMALDRLRELGVRFALTQVGHDDLDGRELLAGGVRFVKLASAPLLLGDDIPGAHRAKTLPLLLRRAGIEVVAERVEDERTVPELIELGVPLAQGLAFALPAPIGTVLPSASQATSTPTARDRPAPSAGAAAVPDPEARHPLRSFLRRAV